MQINDAIQMDIDDERWEGVLPNNEKQFATMLIKLCDLNVPLTGEQKQWLTSWQTNGIAPRMFADDLLQFNSQYIFAHDDKMRSYAKYCFHIVRLMLMYKGEVNLKEWRANRRNALLRRRRKSTTILIRD